MLLIPWVPHCEERQGAAHSRWDWGGHCRLRDAPAIPWFWVWLETDTGRFGDTVRWVCRRSDWVADCRDASAIPSVWVGVLGGWLAQLIGGAIALLGRSGDTMVCGRTYVLHTGAGRYRSGRFAIPCGGPGSGRFANGWDVSATPNGTIVLVLLATDVGALRRYHPRTECKSWPQGSVRACRVVRTLRQQRHA